MNVLDRIKRLENNKRLDLKFVLIFLIFVSITRMIMEILLGRYDYIIYANLSNFVQAFSFYALALVSYGLFLSVCSGKKPINLVRILTPFLLVALLVPLIDYSVSGYPVIYQMSAVSDFDAIRISSNNPLGESVILWLIPIMAAIYVFLERKSIKRFIVTFAVTFFVPVLLATNISDFLGLGSHLYYLYATMVSIVFLLLMFYMQDSEKFGKLFMRFYERMNRIILYIIIFAFGIATTGSLFAVNLFGIYILILLIISFIAMCVNDYFDFSVDKANRKNNLLGSLTKEELKNVIIVSFLVLIPFLVFVYEGIKNVLFTYYIISMLSLIFLYNYKNFVNCPFPLSYVIDALSYSITFMAGRSMILARGEMEMLYFITITIIFLLLIPMKDYGDFKGDKKNRIKTLYTILRFKKAFRLCKAFLVIDFLILSLWFVSISHIGTEKLILFFVLPSVIFLPFIVYNFKKTEDSEKTIWFLDVLLIIYLLPFLF